MPQAIFNGITLEVEIPSTGDSVITMDAQEDFYEPWKDFLRQGAAAGNFNNKRFPQCFRPIAGDFIIPATVQYAGLFFLRNDLGWRFRLPDEDVTLILAGNMALEDTAFPFFRERSGRTGAILGLANFVAGVEFLKKTNAEIHGQVRRSVYVDTTAGSNGDGFQQTPYNNINDGIDRLIADGIRKLVLMANATADRNIPDLIFEGLGNPTFDLNGFDADMSEFEGIQLDGDYTGFITARNCALKDTLTGVNGKFFNCGFQGLFTLASGAATIFSDCFSEVAGLSSPEMDFNTAAAADVKVSLRNSSGGLLVSNSDRAGNEATLEFSAGKLVLAATLTDGTFSLRGIFSLVNNAAGATIDTVAGILPDTILTLGKWLGLRGGTGK